MATVVTPHSFSQPPMLPGRASLVPNLRTPIGQLGVGIDNSRRHVGRRHRHEMYRRMHVDAGGVPLPDRQIASSCVEVRKALPARGVMTFSPSVVRARGEKCRPRGRT